MKACCDTDSRDVASLRMFTSGHIIPMHTLHSNQPQSTFKIVYIEQVWVDQAPVEFTKFLNGAGRLSTLITFLIVAIRTSLFSPSPRSRAAA